MPKSPRRYSFELQVDDVLKGRPLAGACAVTGPDQETLFLPAAHAIDLFIENLGGFGGVGFGADRERVSVGP